MFLDGSDIQAINSSQRDLVKANNWTTSEKQDKSELQVSTESDIDEDILDGYNPVAEEP